MVQVALKVADLGHLAEDEEVHRKWVSRLEGGNTHTHTYTHTHRGRAPVSVGWDDAPKLLYVYICVFACVCVNTEEFFRQGDKERERGIPISPLFDRNKPGVTKSQVPASHTHALTPVDTWRMMNMLTHVVHTPARHPQSLVGIACSDG